LHPIRDKRHDFPMPSQLPLTRRAPRLRVVAALPLVAAVVALLGLSPAGGSTTTRAAGVPTVPGSATPQDPGLAKLQRLATGARATAPAPSRHSGGVRAAANPTSTVVSDLPGDVAPTTFASNLRDRADLADTTNAAGINVGAGSIRLSAKIPLTANPTTDASWTGGDTGITWALSVGPVIPSANIDFLANIAADKEGHMLGGVFTSPPAPQKPKVICYADGAWDGTSTFSISFPSACIGNALNIQFYAQAVYDTTLGHDLDPQTNQPHDWAMGGPPQGPQFSAIVSPGTTPTPIAGGIEADKFGGVQPFTVGGNTPPPPRVSTFWNFDIVRGFAAFPDGGHGYVLDGRGGLWGAALGQNALPIGPIGNAYWTWDIARGVAVTPDGAGGFVVDGYGGLHWFSIGSEHPAPAVHGGPYWVGWDVARGVVILPDGSGGYVLDAFGALHPFGLGSHPAPSATASGTPYWLGWYIARGVTVVPDGTGGYIGDAWGGRHQFSFGGTPPPTVGPYLPGQDKFRGLSVVTGALPLP
jgi:hypothetical protein